jgi:hypothetical protein
LKKPAVPGPAFYLTGEGAHQVQEIHSKLQAEFVQKTYPDIGNYAFEAVPRRDHRLAVSQLFAEFVFEVA